MRFIALVFFCVIAPFFAFAQIPNSAAASLPTTPATDASPKTKSSRINLNAGGAIRINYGQPQWNKNPEKIDTATVIMREGVSGRVVQIQLSETAPDSSMFSGRYSINWQNMEQLETEFYIPSQEMLAQKDGLMKITQKIQAKEIQRNPFIFRKLSNGEQSIEIFDTKDQARAAMKAYRAEQLVMLQNQKPTKFPSDQDFDAEKLALAQKERASAAHEASERARIQQIEAARLADLIAKQNAMNAVEKVAQQQQASKISSEAMKLYKAEDFFSAREKFERAVSMDSDNRAFYFQYGVTLYKTGDNNRALVFLQMATGKDVNPVEKNYFMALTHMKLKENEAALKSFDDVIAGRDPAMALSALFYKGAIYFELENFEASHAAFQTVLDKSNDPKLDERAEAFIEQILRARQASEIRNHKWALSLAVGEIYDSNVLLSADSQRDSGTVTNTAGWRTLLSGSARYRPVFDETQEFAAQLDFVTLYTVDNSLAFDSTLHGADPTVLTLTLPWTRKGVWFNKGHKLDLIPGYETTIMSIENNVSKAIIQSPLLSVSNLLVMNDSWFNNVTLEMRDDISRLDSLTGDNDSTALKFRLGTTNLVFMNDKKDRILIPEGALTMNQAKGRNASYNRADLGIGYLIPTWKETITNFKLTYFYIEYAQKIPAQRADSSYTATVGLTKKLNAFWSTGLLGLYNINRSNEDANTYNKFTVLLTLSAAYGL